VDQSTSRKRDVRLIVGAGGISALGDFLLWTPLTLHIQEMSDSGLAISALFLALWTPVVVLAPALVIWAADDKFFPREHGRRLAELLPQGRFELLEDSRTFIPEDNPSALVRLIERL
jgi:pimeloyl-ACP methyl ester carboxylesterase